jgi:hypothetical protein
MYRIIITKSGAFRSYSKWYSSAEEVLGHFNAWLIAHPNFNVEVTLEVGEPKQNELGF